MENRRSRKTERTTAGFSLASSTRPTRPSQKKGRMITSSSHYIPTPSSARRQNVSGQSPEKNKNKKKKRRNPEARKERKIRRKAARKALLAQQHERSQETATSVALTALNPTSTVNESSGPLKIDSLVPRKLSDDVQKESNKGHTFCGSYAPPASVWKAPSFTPAWKKKGEEIFQWNENEASMSLESILKELTLADDDGCWKNNNNSTADTICTEDESSSSFLEDPLFPEIDVLLRS